MNSNSLYDVVLYDLSSKDNTKRVLAEKACLSYMKTRTGSFFQYLVEVVLNVPEILLSKFALVLLAEMVRLRLVDALLENLVRVAWDACKFWDIQSLAQICAAEAVFVDFLLGGSVFLGILSNPCLNSLKIFRIFTEKNEKIEGNDAKIVVKILKDCLNVDELTLVAVQCLKNCQKYLQAQHDLQELAQIFSNLCIHYDKDVRFESLDGLLDLCESFEWIFIESGDILKVLIEDCVQNKWIASQILTKIKANIDPRYLSCFLMNLHNTELREVTIEYLTSAFELEKNEEYFKFLLFSHKEDPVLYLGILSSLPRNFNYDQSISSQFLQYFFSNSLVIKEQALHVLNNNQHFCKSISPNLNFNYLLSLILSADMPDSIKIPASWVVFNTLGPKLSTKQAEYIISAFLELKNNHELISISYLIITELLPLCSQESIRLFFFPKFFESCFSESDNFTYNCILGTLTQCLLLLHPKLDLQETPIRKLLSSFLDSPQSDSKSHFINTLSELYPSTYAKFEVLITLYLQKS